MRLILVLGIALLIGPAAQAGPNAAPKPRTEHAHADVAADVAADRADVAADGASMASPCARLAQRMQRCSDRREEQSLLSLPRTDARRARVFEAWAEELGCDLN